MSPALFRKRHTDGHSRLFLRASTVHLIDHAIVPRKKNTRGWKIDVGYDRSSSTRHRRRFSSRGLRLEKEEALRSGNHKGKKERERALTLGGLKADQLRVLALTGAVKGPHPGVVKRVEVQPVYRANGLTATVHLLRIRFQTGHP